MSAIHACVLQTFLFSFKYGKIFMQCLHIEIKYAIILAMVYRLFGEIAPKQTGSKYNVRRDEHGVSHGTRLYGRSACPRR